MITTEKAYNVEGTKRKTVDAKMSAEIRMLQEENKSRFNGQLFAEFGVGPYKALLFPIPIKTNEEFDDKINYLVVTRRGFRAITISAGEKEMAEEIDTAIKDKIKYDKQHKIHKRFLMSNGFDNDDFFNTEDLKLGKSLIITLNGLKRNFADTEIVNANCKLRVLDEVQAEEFLNINRKKCASTSTSSGTLG